MASRKKDRTAEREARVAREEMLAQAKSREKIIKWVTIGFVALIFLVLIGILVYNGKKEETQALDPVTFTESPNTILPGGDATSSSTLDPQATEAAVPNGVVVMVEFADIQCPTCKAYHPTVREFTENNPNVKYVFKHFPLSGHQHSRRAAIAAEAAGVQGKFFEMLDVLYANQEEWSGVTDPTQLYLGYAQSIGLDTDKFTQDLSNEELANRVQNDLNEGIAAGVGGTPTFFFNGKKYPGVPDNNVAAFEAIVQAELAAQHE